MEAEPAWRLSARLARQTRPRTPRTASAGVIGGPAGSNPRRFTYSCPSGNRWATRCAQHSASAVLPTPAVPPIAEMITVPPVSARFCSSPVRVASSPARPAKCATAAGSCCGVRVLLDCRRAAILASSGSVSVMRLARKAHVDIGVPATQRHVLAAAQPGHVVREFVLGG
jgi:hypothetical protein